MMWVAISRRICSVLVVFGFALIVFSCVNGNLSSDCSSVDLGKYGLVSNDDVLVVPTYGAYVKISDRADQIASLEDPCLNCSLFAALYDSSTAVISHLMLTKRLGGQSEYVLQELGHDDHSYDGYVFKVNGYKWMMSSDSVGDVRVRGGDFAGMQDYWSGHSGLNGSCGKVTVR